MSHFWIIYIQVDWNTPIVDSFATYEEAEEIMLKFWGNHYTERFYTRQQLEHYAMPSGDNWHIAEVSAPEH